MSKAPLGKQLKDVLVRYAHISPMADIALLTIQDSPELQDEILVDLMCQLLAGREDLIAKLAEARMGEMKVVIK